MDVAHGERVYTVFSASNYCGTSGNLGAVLIMRHGCDVPTETYQWDPREEATMSAPVVSRRKSKEMRKAAAITQATEYIIEHRAALLEYFKRCDGARTGAVSFHAWAKGLLAGAAGAHLGAGWSAAWWGRRTWTIRATGCCTRNGWGTSRWSSRGGARSGSTRW